MSRTDRTVIEREPRGLCEILLALVVFFVAAAGVLMSLGGSYYVDTESWILCVLSFAVGAWALGLNR